MTELLSCDVELLDAQSNLEATKAIRAKHLKQSNEELDTQVAEEFKKDPKVIALMDEIAVNRKLAESNDQPAGPAVLAAREKLATLSKEREALQAKEFAGIRQRLADRDQGGLSGAKILELEVAGEKARRKKQALSKQFQETQVEHKATDDDAFQATVLSKQVESLLGWEEMVKRNLEQLKFEASQDKYRVVLVDSAAAAPTPTHNNRLRYMAAAPVVVLILLLGLFFAQEINAGRRSATG